MRQAHPQFMQNDRITSQVFMPTVKDDGKLSVDDGDKVRPEESYKHYTEVRCLAADSTWGVTCREVDSIPP